MGGFSNLKKMIENRSYYSKMHTMKPKRRHSIVSERHYLQYKKKSYWFHHIQYVPIWIYNYFKEFLSIHKDDVEYLLWYDILQNIV